MKAIYLNPNRTYEHPITAPEPVQPVPAKFFHNAIIIWMVFVSLIAIVLSPVALAVILAKKIRTLF